MNRYDFEDHISAYLDGDLDTEEIKEFERIIEEFPDCNEKYLSLRVFCFKAPTFEENRSVLHC